jgi:hypothetical protein
MHRKLNSNPLLMVRLIVEAFQKVFVIIQFSLKFRLSQHSLINRNECSLNIWYLQYVVDVLRQGSKRSRRAQDE